jgi:hypothetical protein
LGKLIIKNVWPAAQLNFEFSCDVTEKQREELRKRLSNISFSGLLRLEIFGKRIVFSTSVREREDRDALIRRIQSIAHEILKQNI